MNPGTAIIAGSALSFVLGLIGLLYFSNRFAELVCFCVALAGAAAFIPLMWDIDNLVWYQNLVHGKYEDAITPGSGPPAPGTLQPADVSKVAWTAAKPEEVTFPPLPSGQKWAVLHPDIAGSNPNGVYVTDSGGTLYRYSKDLMKLQVFVDGPSGPETALTDVRQTP